LDTKKEVLSILDEVLNLGGASAQFDLDTQLLGALPDLDSMAVVGLINLLEERLSSSSRMTRSMARPSPRLARWSISSTPSWAEPSVAMSQGWGSSIPVVHCV
jgi:acyl carrier protein